MVTGTEVCGPSTVGSLKVMIPRTTFRQTLPDAGSQTRPFFWRRGTHRGKPQRATTNQMGLLLRRTPHQSRDVDPGAVEKARSRYKVQNADIFNPGRDSRYRQAEIQGQRRTRSNTNGPREVHDAEYKDNRARSKEQGRFVHR